MTPSPTKGTRILQRDGIVLAELASTLTRYRLIIRTRFCLSGNSSVYQGDRPNGIVVVDPGRFRATLQESLGTTRLKLAESAVTQVS